MRLVFAAPVFLLLVHCATAPSTPLVETPEPVAQADDTWGPQAPQEAWWEEAQPCPDGAELVGAPPPEGTTVQCLLRSGERHGRVSVWFPNGHEGTYGEYVRDERHGRWMHWLHGRKLVEGGFDTGRRHGTWAYFFDENSEFDVQDRTDWDQPIFVERYNHGLLVTKGRGGTSPPEDVRAGDPPAVATPTE